MLVNMNVKTVTLNDTVEEKWLWTSKHKKMVTQGPRMNMYNGSECQTREWRWHWMLNKTMVLNAQNWERWWLKMHEWVWKTALNAKLKEKCGSGGKRQIEQWFWMSKLKKINDSKGSKERAQWLLTSDRRKMVMDQTKDRHEDLECRTKTTIRNSK